LNTNKLKIALKREKITQKELSEKLGLSERGLGQMIINNSFKVSTLEEISSIIGVSMTYWWDDEDELSVLNEPNEEYKIDPKMEILNLKREIKRLESHNQTLEKFNQQLLKQLNRTK